MSLESLRKLAGGPKVEAAKAVAGFLNWCATYVPPSRWSALEIDGVKPVVFAAPEEHSAPAGTYARCRRCPCKADASGLCFHCVFGDPCPVQPTGEREPSRFDFVEIDNPVDHDAVADGVVMAFFAIRAGHGSDFGIDSLEPVVRLSS